MSDPLQRGEAAGKGGQPGSGGAWKVIWEGAGGTASSSRVITTQSRPGIPARPCN